MSDDATGYEIVTVRENSRGENDIGISLHSEPPEIRGTQDYGFGTDLRTPAANEIRERLDLEEHDGGERIARIRYDLDAWTYDVEYLVPVTILDRVWESVSSALSRGEP